MTVKVRLLGSPCDAPNCGRAAVYQTTFETHRGTLNGPKVCQRHVGWGKQRAKQMEES